MDLTTNYLGMALKNPIVASSSPLSHNVDSIRRLEDAGAAAVVMYSLFEEQITFDSFYIDYYLTSGTNSYAESLSYFPEMQSYNVWPDEYMNLIRRAINAFKTSCELWMPVVIARSASNRPYRIATHRKGRRSSLELLRTRRGTTSRVSRSMSG